MSANFRIKAIYMIGKRKPFYRQRIPEFNCVRKETAEIDSVIGMVTEESCNLSE